MRLVDTLIHARHVVPIEPEGQVLDDHAVAVADGLIVAVLPSAEARATFSAVDVVERPNHVLMPGLVNTHTHAAMTLMRGLSDDLALMDWLEGHVWPTEAKYVSPEFVRAGTELAIAEFIKGGVTCFNDMYFFPDVVAATAEHHGIRAGVGLIVIEFPSAWARTPDEYFSKGIELAQSLRGSKLIKPVFAPHAPYTVSDDSLKRIRTLSAELNIPVQIHLHETAFEVESSVKQYGVRPFARLRELGLIGPDVMAVHMTQLSTDEITEAARSNLKVIHCPESNLKLASGFCPVDKLLEAGVCVGLGTDGAASNNDLDLLGEMRTAALLAKAVAQDARALPAAKALRMATLDGARALGRDAEIGSIVPGKAADLIALDFKRIATVPLYSVISHLVYAAQSSQVSDVWIAGRRKLKDSQLVDMNEAAIIQQAQAWATVIRP